jgi:hypothetical protein
MTGWFHFQNNQKNGMEMHSERKRVANVVCDQLRVPRRVKRAGGSAVTLWQSLSSTIIGWVLPEALVCVVWEFSFSFIPQGMLSISFLLFSSSFARTIRAEPW